jgi:hypothetical protein
VRAHSSIMEFKSYMAHSSFKEFNITRAHNSFKGFTARDVPKIFSEFIIQKVHIPIKGFNVKQAHNFSQAYIRPMAHILYCIVKYLSFYHKPKKEFILRKAHKTKKGLISSIRLIFHLNHYSLRF